MEKIVEYDLYCYKCKHYKLSDSEFPCDECLDNPSNEDSRKPIYFKEAENGTSSASKRRIRKNS